MPTESFKDVARDNDLHRRLNGDLSSIPSMCTHSLDTCQCIGNCKAWFGINAIYGLSQDEVLALCVRVEDPRGSTHYAVVHDHRRRVGRIGPNQRGFKYRHACNERNEVVVQTQEDNGRSEYVHAPCDWVFVENGKIVEHNDEEYYVAWSVDHINEQHACAVIRFDVALSVPEVTQAVELPPVPIEDKQTTIMASDVGAFKIPERVIARLLPAARVHDNDRRKGNEVMCAILSRCVQDGVMSLYCDGANGRERAILNHVWNTIHPPKYPKLEEVGPEKVLRKRWGSVGAHLLRTFMVFLILMVVPQDSLWEHMERQLGPLFIYTPFTAEPVIKVLRTLVYIMLSTMANYSLWYIFRWKHVAHEEEIAAHENFVELEGVRRENERSLLLRNHSRWLPSTLRTSQ
jgi:hypothetical protein